VRDEIAQYRDADVQPFGVEATGDFGALKADGKRIQRTVVLVDRDGTVVFSARGMPGASESLPALQGR
jgi:hypothetical protein